MLLGFDVWTACLWCRTDANADMVSHLSDNAGDSDAALLALSVGVPFTVIHIGGSSCRDVRAGVVDVER